MGTVRRPTSRQLIDEMWALLGRAHGDIREATGYHPSRFDPDRRPPKHDATDLVEVNGVWMTPEDAHDRVRRLR